MPRGSVSSDGKRKHQRPQDGCWVVDVHGARQRIPELRELPLSCQMQPDAKIVTSGVLVTFSIPGAHDFFVTRVRAEDLDSHRWLQTLVRCAAVRYAAQSLGYTRPESGRKMHEHSAVRPIIARWMPRSGEWIAHMGELRNTLVAADILGS